MTIKIQQCDRVAAREFINEVRFRDCEEITKGEWDSSPAVQAFAKHRIEAMEEAAKIAEREYAGFGWHPSAINAGIGIAEALRDAAHKGGKDE